MAARDGGIFCEKMSANLPRPSTEENVSSTLSSGITDVATTVTIADASKLVAPCYLVVDRVDSSGTLKSTSLWEYIKVTNIAGNDLTVTRGVNNSTAQAHSAGAIIEAVVTSAMFEDWYNVLNPEHDNNGGHVITGTMTVAGMNLASVATIASMGVGVARVLTHLNVSGASISGVFASDPFNINRLGVTSAATINYLDISTRANFASLASAPKIMRTNINSNLYFQMAVISGVSVANANSITVTKAWDAPFSTFLSCWGIVARATNQSNIFVVQSHENSNPTIAGAVIQNNAAGAEQGATIHLYGIGTKEGSY